MPASSQAHQMDCSYHDLDKFMPSTSYPLSSTGAMSYIEVLIFLRAVPYLIPNKQCESNKEV